MAENFRVTFQPWGKSISVPRGISLVDAATMAGLTIETPCGGQGRCGRCAVRVLSGEVSLSEPTRLSPKQVEEGWVLSCASRVIGDLAILVPEVAERERVAREAMSTISAPSPKLPWSRCPAVERLFLELPAPTLDDNASDLERLKRALEEKGEFELELPLLKKLPQVLREGNWKVTVWLHSGGKRIIDLEAGHTERPLFGTAVDIGSTNVALALVDLDSGKLIERISTQNRQIICGEDVISRIIYSGRQDGLERLHQLAVETINELLSAAARKHDLSTSEVEEMIVAGNTTMTHLFLDLTPGYIREEPYIPLATHFPQVSASELGVDINPHSPVFCLPAMGSWVGGDITAGILSSGIFESDKLTLFLDVGTNGEIVLGNSDWMAACSCSAGPAFEGAGVKCGMRATEGAIEEVRINSKTLEPTIRVVGEVAPVGICGTGMLSTLAEMLLTGIIDRAGHIDSGKPRVRSGEYGAEYVIVWAPESGMGQDLVLTQVDINNLVRAKAAIYAGIRVMLRHLGITPSEIEEVLIGGAFGEHLNVEQAIQIGLLPDLPWKKFKYLGNTSLWGAYQVLLSKEARTLAEEIANKLTYIELAADSSFMGEFTAALFLPHTNLNSFPSVKRAVEKLKT